MHQTSDALQVMHTLAATGAGGSAVNAKLLNNRLILIIFFYFW